MMNLSNLLKQDAKNAENKINQRFALWEIKINQDLGAYVFTAPNGSKFSTDTMYSDTPNTIELKKAKELHSLIVQYQEGSGDIRLKFLRKDKAGNY